jgi:glycerol-3-phosphate dehydrogenase
VITADEVKYLLRAANYEFPQAKLTTSDVIATFSGVRPIVSSGKGLDPSKERRDHAVWADKGVISVSGGKLTTFRQIAQDVLTAAESWLPKLKERNQKTSIFSNPSAGLSTPLNGEQYRRFIGKYGYLAQKFLAEMPVSELTIIPQTQTLWAELRWALRYEQVVHLDDLMLRRTRLGLLLEQGGAAHFETIKKMALSEGWAEDKWASEQARYSAIWQQYYSLPNSLK